MGDPDRLEREIEEILGKIENFPGPGERRVRRALSHPAKDAVVRRQRAVVREISRISVSQVMLGSFLLILGSFFFRDAGVIAVWALYAGIVLFVVSFAIMMFGNRARLSPSHQETVWRGRHVSYGPYGRSTASAGRATGQSAPPVWLTRVRRWWAAQRTNRSRR